MPADQAYRSRFEHGCIGVFDRLRAMQATQEDRRTKPSAYGEDIWQSSNKQQDITASLLIFPSSIVGGEMQ